MGLVHVRLMGLVLVAVDSMHDVQSLNTDAQYSGFHKGPVSPSPPAMMDHGQQPQKKYPPTLVDHGRRPQKIYGFVGESRGVKAFFDEENCRVSNC